MFLVSDAQTKAVHDAYDAGGKDAAKRVLAEQFRGLDAAGADTTLRIILSWPHSTPKPPADVIPFGKRALGRSRRSDG